MRRERKINRRRAVVCEKKNVVQIPSDINLTLAVDKRRSLLTRLLALLTLRRKNA